MKYHALRDTREKPMKGWYFGPSEYCEGMTTTTLKEGDYTIKGMEDSLIIERKGAMNEFANNILQPRFYRELDRLSLYDHPYLILEFTLDELLRYPASLSLSPAKIRRIKLSGSFLVRKYIEITLKYPKIQVMLVGKHGMRVAASIFKQILEDK